jgi:mitochondrial transcription factor 1
LWSSKLHDFVKPRRHILVEPERELYNPFIEPLLSSSPSVYQHAASLAEVLDPETGLLHAIRKECHEDAASDLNASLLIVANATRRGVTGRRDDSNYAGAIGKHMLHTFYNSMFHHAQESLHRYGRVRVLAWLPDDDKASVLPRTVASRGKQAVQWDLLANISEVAGGGSYQQSALSARRHYELDMESERVVMQRTFRNAVRDASSRQPPPTRPVPASFNLDEAGLAAMHKSPNRPKWTDELVDLEERYKMGDFAIKSKQGKRLRTLRNRRVTVYNSHRRAMDIAQRQRSLDRGHEVKSTSDIPQDIPSGELRPRDGVADGLRTERGKLQREYMLLVDKCIDDQRAFDHVPPVLAWDRREAEPLWAEKNEFYPSKTLALLDFQPRLTEFLSRLDTPGKKLCFDHVTSMLLQHPGKSVAQGLEQMVHDGLDQFLQKVPSLRDPQQGGRPDLDDFRIRSLPVELLVDLALAWESWPFRPEISTPNVRLDRLGYGTFVDD